MTAEQIMRKAIATLCDADFGIRMPLTRKSVMVEDLVAMNKRCEEIENAG